MNILGQNHSKTPRSQQAVQISQKIQSLKHHQSRLSQTFYGYKHLYSHSKSASENLLPHYKTTCQNHSDYFSYILMQYTHCLLDQLLTHHELCLPTIATLYVHCNYTYNSNQTDLTTKRELLCPASSSSNQDKNTICVNVWAFPNTSHNCSQQVIQLLRENSSFKNYLHCLQTHLQTFRKQQLTHFLHCLQYKTSICDILKETA